MKSMGSKKIDVSTLGRIVSTNIRAQLGIRRMSNRELARKMGRSESYVRARINDEKEWNLNDLGIISQIWAIPPDRLVAPMIDESPDDDAHADGATALAGDASVGPEPDFLAMAAKHGGTEAEREAAYREARGTEPIDIDAWADRIRAEDSIHDN